MVSGTSFIIAASSILALALGAPVPRNSAKAVRSLAERDFSYTVFSGDGTTAKGWPTESAWMSFDKAWNTALPTIKASCTQFGVDNNLDTETAAVRAGLVSVSTASGVDSRYLLAIMMQESKGCVRAPTTNYGVRNPGLFQDYNGEASCNDGTVIKPCPDATITKMIQEGSGMGMEVGLSIGIAATGDSDVSKYYKAARIYNSGSIDSSGNLGAGIATHCYVSDIANRLLGWVEGGSTCSESTIASLTGSAPFTSSSAVESTTTTATVTPVASTSNSATTVVPSVAAAPSSTFPGAASGCKSWYEVKAGDNCQSTGVEFATLAKLNPGLDSTCSNLWLGYSYCTSA